MINPADSEPLLSVILDDQTRRERSLNLALAELRRARCQRSARHRIAFASAALTLVLAAYFVGAKSRHAKDYTATAIPSAAPASAAPVEIISDDELLDLFPGRAVALVGPAAHRRLIFLSESQ